MTRLLLATVLGSALCMPAALLAQDDGHDRDHRSDTAKTYYDAGHKDRHEWNSNEDEAWKRYREDHHVSQSDFARASKKQQQAYWNWRHEHPDQH